MLLHNTIFALRSSLFSLLRMLSLHAFHAATHALPAIFPKSKRLTANFVPFVAGTCFRSRLVWLAVSAGGWVPAVCCFLKWRLGCVPIFFWPV